MDKRHKSFDLVIGKVLGRGPVGDGSTLEEVHGFRRDDRGLLEAKFRVLPLIPSAWRSPAAQPAAFADGVNAIIYWRRWGAQPELLFLTGSRTSAVWRYAPWTRAAGIGFNPGLEAVNIYNDTTASNLTAGIRSLNPPTYVTLADYVVFSLGDGGATWMWDGFRLLPLGFDGMPGTPQAKGPAPSSSAGTSTTNNSGGFSVYGRIGDTDGSWLDDAGTQATVGGLKSGKWRYACVFKHVDGSYSPVSATSAPIGMVQQVSDGTNFYNLTRRFWVQTPTGPSQTAGIVLLRTMNLDGAGADGVLRFHSYIPHNEGPVDLLDDLPDGELGPIWQERESEPVAVACLALFDGGLWRCGTLANPSRCWWSERTSVGPLYGSILQGHWLDVYPTTGAIVAVVAAPWKTDSGMPFAVVLKSGAAHYVTGSYPEYTAGTLHGTAGCYGPRLALVCPDGAIIWMGSGTVWRYAADTGVVDIGAPIRRKLARINVNRANFGVAWIDARSGEAVFALPVDDNRIATYQFIWDFELGGWRTRSEMRITAACSLPGDLVLLAGTVDSTTGVFGYNRASPVFNHASPVWELRSAWVPQMPGGDMHRDSNFWIALVVCEERGSGTNYARIYSDWDGDNAVGGASNGLVVPAAHPTNSSIPYYGTAVYDTAVWRTPRNYRVPIPSDGTSSNVIQVKISGTLPFAAWALHGFGLPALASGGGRAVPTTGGAL